MICSKCTDLYISDIIKIITRISAHGSSNHCQSVQVAGHKDVLEGDPYLKQRLRLRESYITTLNVCQAYTLKRIRDPSFEVMPQQPPLSKEFSDKEPAELVQLNRGSEYAPGLEDTLILTMKGIAAGMQNTG
jgi:phosphoenolpyruvate carboxylase